MDEKEDNWNLTPMEIKLFTQGNLYPITASYQTPLWEDLDLDVMIQRANE